MFFFLNRSTRSPPSIWPNRPPKRSEMGSILSSSVWLGLGCLGPNPTEPDCCPVLLLTPHFLCKTLSSFALLIMYQNIVLAANISPIFWYSFWMNAIQLLQLVVDKCLRIWHSSSHVLTSSVSLAQDPAVHIIKARDHILEVQAQVQPLHGISPWGKIWWGLDP